jgi:Cd2+/Zn2+-exporting ATPase
MDLMKQHSCNCDEIEEVHENDKHMFMCVAINKFAIATICVADEVREDAVRTVRELKKAGVHTAMLTGDKAEIAEDIAQRLGMDEVHAQLLPEDKLRILSQIRSKHGTVSMVGDGINDAPALAASDVGIAMGGKGTDVALESADVVLVKDKLEQIPYLLRLSDETVKIAKQNIVASVAVKMVLGALGLIGLVPLWFTVASGDDGLTSLVLLNTLRLARVKT